MKRGRLSNTDKQYIIDNAATSNYVKIAAILDKDPQMVKKFIENKLQLKTTLSENAKPLVKDNPGIRDKDFWKILQTQFSPEELDMFEYQWDKIYEQFGGDILPTEELQILDTIKLEILMNRSLKEQKDCMDKIFTLELQADDENSKGDTKNKDLLFELNRQVEMYRRVNVEKAKEYLDLQAKKSKQFGDLKATRSQRIKNIENSRESFLQWLTEIIDNREVREELGKKMEKYRLAAIAEEVRLSAYHKYIDGNLDLPLYNDNSVKSINQDKHIEEN